MSDPLFSDEKKSSSKKAAPTPAPEKESLSLKYSLVELPSKGLLGYPEEVEYRDILVRDEKELASATEKTFSTILNKILKSLLKDDSFFEELTIYDRDYLLLWIWANNYSTQKQVEIICPHCEAHNSQDVDLTELDVDELADNFQNPYPLKLSNGNTVHLKLLTVLDEVIARKYSQANKDTEESFALLCQSVNFDTVLPLREKINRIENEFTGKDMATIRGFHAHFKYGVKDMISYQCSSCGEVSEFQVPFQIDLFLPTLQDDFR